MKITIESREEFLKALDLGGLGLPKTRPLYPIMAAIKLTILAKGAHGGTGELAVSSYDGTTCAKHTITTENSMSQGEPAKEILVNGNLLIDLVKNFPHKHPIILQIGKNSKALEMHCGKYKCNLPLMPVNEYPNTPNAPSSMAGVVKQHELAKFVQRLTISAAKDETFPILTGANITLGEDGMHGVSTDRYRLVYTKIPWSEEGKKDAIVGIQQGSYLLKAQALQALSRKSTGYELMGIHPPTKKEQVINFTVREINQNKTKENDEDTNEIGSANTTLLEGEYPAALSIIPKNPVATARFSKEDMMEALKFANTKLPQNQPILFKFENGAVNISSDDSSGTTTETTVEGAMLNGAETVEIAFNPQYIIAAIDSFDTEQVELRFAALEGVKPAYLVGVHEDGEVDESYIHLLMPVRRQNNPEER